MCFDVAAHIGKSGCMRAFTIVLLSCCPDVLMSVFLIVRFTQFLSVDRVSFGHSGTRSTKFVE